MKWVLGRRLVPRPHRGQPACAEFDMGAAVGAVDSRGVELGDCSVVSTVFRSDDIKIPKDKGD